MTAGAGGRIMLPFTPGAPSLPAGRKGAAPPKGAAMANEQDRMEQIVSLAKRRGFIFPSSEIYGGINGFWDYGPLGVELKRNVKDAWWQDIVRTRSDIVGLDCSIIMNPKVWEASGHVSGFNDPMVECKQCKARFRADQVYVVRYVQHAPPAGCAPRSVVHTLVASSEEDARKSDSLTRHEASYLGTYLDPDVDDYKTYCSSQGPASGIACPNCGNAGTLMEPRQFNLMF